MSFNTISNERGIKTKAFHDKSAWIEHPTYVLHYKET